MNQNESETVVVVLGSKGLELSSWKTQHYAQRFVFFFYFLFIFLFSYLLAWIRTTLQKS